MTVSPIVGLVFDAWQDLDRVLHGLNPEEATHQVDGGSSFAWTLAHIANQLDNWVNVRLQGLSPHPLFTDPGWRMGGSGVASNWDEIRTASLEVRESARPFLAGLDAEALERQSAYAGALEALQGKQVSVRYTLQRIAVHTYFHIGEIAAVRSRRLGQSIGDYPGPMLDCL